MSAPVDTPPEAEEQPLHSNPGSSHHFLRRAALRRRNPKLRETDVTVTPEPAVKRAVKATMLGNAMEWFDFGVYAYLAVTIGKVFFPSGNDTAQVLSSLATFAAAFLVRPLGGMVFGPLGDRIGRKKVLALTMIMMSTATFAIGVLPGYATVGLWAPALLIFFRMVQGFSTGGEYGGAATFIAEYAPDKRRGFFGSFLEFGTLIGYTFAAVLVTVLQTVLSDAQMLDWGWRIPFMVAAPMGLVGLYLRMRLEETPAFQQMEDESSAGGGPQERVPFLQRFAGLWPAIAVCIALVAAYNVADYILLSYMPTYLQNTVGYSGTAGLMAIVIVMLILMALINAVGRLSDSIGRKPLLLAGSIGFLVLPVPAFLLIGTGHWISVFAGLMLLGLPLLCLLATMSSVLPALFPTALRYGALAIAFNISVSLFGGTAPLAVEALVSATGNDLMPAYYVMAFAVVGIIAVATLKESAGKPLEGSPPSVATREEARELVQAQYDRA
ncbi:MFS transporter [Streptomyces sp. YC504]|uniref:Putative proline/betaine transporter n=1 Tax=Streptomyces mesophilus TaxID=1775132 RepID=A0A6G4XG39_9ACTN|nr:MFS transporter [Streptomyces mesophilus]NGO76368.1 MFS transporter [Streptomyces mesophilus]